MLTFLRYPRTRKPLAVPSTSQPRRTRGKPARMRRSFGLGLECPERRTVLSTLTVSGCTITGNQADGGAAGAGVSAGIGVGGGVYLATGGVAEFDPLTTISGNTASTIDDDVFGVSTTLQGPVPPAWPEP
jgi:hypothetical protein